MGTSVRVPLSVRAAIIGIACATYLVPAIALAVSASIESVFPASSVPAGVRVSFIVVGSGFASGRTYYVVDSFPGGVTSVNVDAAGNFAWTPNKDDVGMHGITITISDSEGNTATVNQTLTVAAAATLTAGTPSPSAAVSVGTAITIPTTAAYLFNPTYSASDSVSSSIQSYNMKADGTFSWTPLPQDVGEHVITLKAKDSYASEATDSVTITVLPPPAVSIKNLKPGASVPANSALTFDIVSAGFVTPTYVVTDDFTTPSTSTVTVGTDGHVSWTPNPNDYGKHVLHAAAREGDRAATTTLTIDVGAPLPVSATPAPVPAAPETTPAPTSQASTLPAPTVVNKTPSKSVPTPAVQAPATTPTPSQSQEPSLAYPSAPADVAQPIISEPGQVPGPETPTPSFTEFIWGHITGFFSGILGFFSR